MNTRQRLGTARPTVTTSKVEVVRRGDELTIFGAPADVGQAVDDLKAAGKLAWLEYPTPTRPGRIRVVVGLVPQRRPPWAVAGIIGGAAAVVGGVGWAAYVVWTAIVEHAAYIVGGLTFVALLLVAISKAVGGGGGGSFSGTFQGRMH